MLREHREHPHQAHTADPEDREQGRDQGDPEAPEVAGEAFVEDTEDVSREDDHHSPVPVFNDLGTAVEDGQQAAAAGKHQGNGQHRGKDAFGDGHTEDLPAAVELPGAVVLGYEGGACLGEGIQDVVTEDLDVERRTAGGHDHGAEAVDGSLDDDVGNGEHRALETGGQADAQDPGCNGPAGVQVMQGQPDGFVGFQEDRQQDQGADDIGDHRGNGHSCHGEMHNNHEEEIEDHVDDTRYRQGQQRGLCLADAAEDRGLEVVEEDGGHPGEVDAHVLQGMGVHVGGDVHEGETRPDHRFTDQRGGQSAGDGQQQGGLDRLFDGFRFPLPHRLGYDHIGTQGNAHEEIHEQADDGTVRTDSSHGFSAPGLGEGADNGDVRGVEELLEHAGGGNRQRKKQDPVPDRSLQHGGSWMCRRFVHGLLLCAGSV